MPAASRSPRTACEPSATEAAGALLLALPQVMDAFRGVMRRQLDPALSVPQFRTLNNADVNGYTYMGVSEYFNKPCGAFSSGMLKKMSLAIAFLGNPKLIILDEPLVTLDIAARAALMELILAKLSDRKVTFLMSSHQSMDTSVLPVRNTYEIQNKTIVTL